MGGVIRPRRNPAFQYRFLRIRQRKFRGGGRHLLIGILRQNSPYQLTRLNVTSTDRAATGCRWRGGPFTLVQPQFSLSLPVIGAVTLETELRQDRSDLFVLSGRGFLARSERSGSHAQGPEQEKSKPGGSVLEQINHRGPLEINNSDQTKR